MTVAFRGLASIVETGYYQLYFLLVIMQFYLVFPLVLVLRAMLETCGTAGWGVPSR
jgi:peptidoglycan/LPS O-acetylase OafA/YrhL